MSRAASQSNVWDFQVEQLPMVNPVNGKNIPNLYGNFRMDTGDCIGCVTEQYGLIQNAALVKAAENALDAKGMTDYDVKTIVTDGGRKFFATYTFKNRQIANKVGDIFGYELTLQNSYDRTKRASFMLGFLRLACTNGMTTLEKEFSATRRHSNDITVDFLGEAIDNAFNRGQDALRVYDKMAEVEITDVQGVNIIDNFVKIKALSGKLADGIRPIWLNPRREVDKPRNIYNLYNAATEFLTHQVQGERFEYARGTNTDLLFRLSNAARNEKTLQELVKPVEIVVEA